MAITNSEAKTMSKRTANNTCAKCSDFIDKSDAGTPWMTIQRTGYWVNENDSPMHIKGKRLTFCDGCYGAIWALATKTAYDAMLRGTENEVSNNINHSDSQQRRRQMPILWHAMGRSTFW